MAEDENLEYKESQSNVSARAVQGSFRISSPARIVPRTGRLIVANRAGAQRRRSTPAEYPAFKATMVAFAEDIKGEIRQQHGQTRAEVQATRRDVLAAVKSSPAEYLKLVCQFGSLALLFALLVRFALKIELVNTAFALFMLFSFAFYWIMARQKQASEKRIRDGRGA